MNRRWAFATVAIASAAALGGAAGPALASSPNAAVVIKSPDSCTLSDGNGNTAVGNVMLVVNVTGNVVKCSSDVTPSSTGHAVTFANFPCDANGVVTTNSHETVSASGKATLVCVTAG